jgi:glycosyltransferase involved in cell wall biosynthesis
MLGYISLDGVMRKTGVVIPCYNEAERLDTKAFLAALAGEPNLTFLFVDDGCTDGTVQVLASIKAQNPNQVVILRLEHNSGKAEAVRRGMLKLIDGGYENVGYWDADLATPLDAIRDFCGKLDHSDISLVMGSRVKLLGRRIVRNPLRHYVGRVFATCASLLLRIGVYDTQCGAKMFKNSAVLRKVFAKPFKVNWTFDVEMLARFPLVSGETTAQISSSWYEYPLKEWIDVKGSKVKPKDFLVGGIEFCRLFTCLYTPTRKRYEKYLITPPTLP